MIFALIAEKVRGVMSEDQVDQLGDRIFPCGHCRAPDIKVFHNVMGRHMHIHDQAGAHEAIRVCAASSDIPKS